MSVTLTLCIILFLFISCCTFPREKYVDANYYIFYRATKNRLQNYADQCTWIESKSQVSFY